MKQSRFNTRLLALVVCILASAVSILAQSEASVEGGLLLICPGAIATRPYYVNLGELAQCPGTKPQRSLFHLEMKELGHAGQSGRHRAPQG